MADNWQLPGPQQPRPYFEPIGREAPDSPDSDGEGAGSKGRPSLALRAAGRDWRGQVRTQRFWAVTGGAAAAVWIVAGMVLWLLWEGAGSAEPLSVSAYYLPLVLLPAGTALVALHWGMACRRLFEDQAETPGVVAPIIAAILRSLVFAVLVVLPLPVLAVLAGQSAGTVAVAAAVAAAEAAIFSGVGVAVASLVRGRGRAWAAGWTVGLYLVAGGLLTCVLLVPAVRSEEPVTVAMNVEQPQDGVFLAYECSTVPAGTAEVYRTDRIMWLAATSPSVVFLMLAPGQEDGAAPLSWLSSRLQEAADGTQVPCVNGEPFARDAAHVPLGAAGLLIQGGVAGALLGWAGMVTRRREAAAVSP